MNVKNLMTMACVAMAMVSSAFAKQLKVLMIGNSFSVCVLKEMPQCAADAGVVLDLASLYIGGCPLDRHWENVEKSNDPDFKPYSFTFNYASAGNKEEAPVAKLGKKTNIPQALKADKWDIVTIQQASAKSPYPETYEPFAKNLIATIRELAPQAEIVIQQTWSYSPYSERLVKWKMTPQTMYSAVESAYAQLASRYNLRIIPMGYAVELYRRKLPVKYAKVLSEKEISAIVKPGLIDFCGDPVGSSSWRTVRNGQNRAEKIKLRVDSIHLNSEGNYLQACTWLAALFGCDVARLKYAPQGLAPERAALMRACAAEAAAKYAK
ncbi:MAG: DUF4886 domain-containing protein [Kiritimatiellae bacterium]|nr:DUF4886 domain-containing protein [Kiritimatiellia bacterium]